MGCEVMWRSWHGRCVRWHTLEVDTLECLEDLTLNEDGEACGDKYNDEMSP